MKQDKDKEVLRKQMGLLSKKWRIDAWHPLKAENPRTGDALANCDQLKQDSPCETDKNSKLYLDILASHKRVCRGKTETYIGDGQWCWGCTLCNEQTEHILSLLGSTNCD